MKSRIGTLDGLEYICALGVVFLHTLNNAGLSSRRREFIFTLPRNI